MADFVTLFVTPNTFRFYADNNGSNQAKSAFYFSYDNCRLDWQTEKPYETKAKFDDVATLMVHVQANFVGSVSAYPNIEVYDIHDNLIITLSAPPYTKGLQQNPNNFYVPDDGSSPILLDSYLWQFSFGNFLSSATDSGCYYLKFTNTAADGVTTALYRSEPILVYDVQPNTVVIKSQNFTNRKAQNMLLDGWHIDAADLYFYQRVEGYVSRFKPKGIYISYLQQEYLSQQLNSRNFKSFTFFLGGSPTAGVPYYVLDSVGEMLIMDYFEIHQAMQDGTISITPYTIDSESGSNEPKLVWDDLSDPEASQLVWAEKTIRERNNNQNAFYSKVPLPPPPDLDLWISPWKDPSVTNPSPPNFMPYAVPYFGINTTITIGVLPTKVLYTEAEEDAYLIYLNTTLLPALALGGSIARVTGKFKYIPATGETPTIYGVCAALYRRFRADFVTSTGALNIEIGCVRSSTTLQVIDWNDGSAYETNNGAGFAAITHTFPSTLTTYNTWVFHNDNITSYSFYDVANAKINALIGDFPSELISFSLGNALHGVGGFALPASIPINRCTKLGQLFVNNTNITTFTGMFPTGIAYNYLGYISFEQNKLNSSVVDGLFNSFIANTPSFISGGNFQTDGQTPPAPPTGASLTARNALSAAGWTIGTD